MKRLVLLLSAISIALLAAGSAGAGNWWTSQYDLTGSQHIVSIYDPNFPYPVGPAFQSTPHALTGTMVVEWGAATLSGPITQGRLVGGDTYVDQYDQAALFTLTGHTYTVLLPPHPGQSGAIAGSVFDVGVVSDSVATGFLHCIAGACALAGETLTVPTPLTPTGPRPWTVPLGPWTFNSPATAGLGTMWESDSPVDLIPYDPDDPEGFPYTIAIEEHYIGHEISRVPEPGSVALLLPGIGLLGALGWLRLRRR